MVNDKHIDYVKFVDEIVFSFMKEVEKEYPIRCNGTGGSMPRDVEEVSVFFISDKSMTLEEGRRLNINLTEKLIDMINSHEKIRPYLREFPFVQNRIWLSIDFYPKKKKQSNSEKYISSVCHLKDVIIYEQENLDTHKDEEILREPYEDALNFVRNKISESN